MKDITRFLPDIVIRVAVYILESLYIYELCIKEDFGTPSGVCAFGGRIYTQERKKERKKERKMVSYCKKYSTPLQTAITVTFYHYLRSYRDIDRLGNWARKWGMRFQHVKCNMMQLTRKHSNKIKASYTLEGTVIENVDIIWDTILKGPVTTVQVHVRY